MFTTSEMLNQRISDVGYRKLLGIQPDINKRLKFILLDEIHTYTGMSGAQVALLIRRWMWALKSHPKMVGLSATLGEPVSFFSQLSGLQENEVFHLEPSREDMYQRSMQYQLIVRGDPASKTSLLSTSIQTAMVMARLLDQTPGANGGQVEAADFSRYGSRLFAFTDDLDVTNRFYDDFRDAEGLGYSKSNSNPPLPLASLRSGNNAEPTARDAQGQNWANLETLGRNLNTPLRVSRTSSQDSGVNRNSEVIIATAALEVGFDDPQVGIVLQHKAPFGLAGFIQRKGRAGRLPTMRPWMITVLSDYGRDRLAFQSYETYFDVLVPSQSLPIQNRYLIRMQVVFAFFDWLASSEISENLRYGWWWKIADGPADNRKTLQKKLLGVVRDLQDEQSSRYERFVNYIQKSLGISDRSEIEDLIWSPPRSLMLEVLPTLERRLSVRWAAHSALSPAITKDLSSPPGPPHPLPDYIPRRLFSDLDLPELEVELEEAEWRSKPRIVTMPIIQCLRTFAPGKVSRRFGTEHASVQHWVPIPITKGEHDLDIEDFCVRVEPIGNVVIHENGSNIEIPFYRPWTIRTARVKSKDVGTSSNSFLRWQTNLRITGDPVVLSRPVSNRWNETVGEIQFCLNRLRSPLLERRFATGTDANLKINYGDVNVSVNYVKQESKVGLGFEQAVDAMIVDISLPSVEQITERIKYSKHTKSWRVGYFYHLLDTDPVLVARANKFQRAWIAEFYLSALIEEALLSKISLSEACKRIHNGQFREKLERVAKAIFQSSSETLSESESSDDSKLAESIVDLLEDSNVESAVEALATQLWDTNSQRFSIWLKGRLHESMGEAVIESAVSLAPLHTTPDALQLDLNDGISESEDQIWISESSLGGTGVIEEISIRISENQVRFMEELEASISPKDLEMVARNLNRYVTLASTDEEVKNILNDLRNESGRRKGEELRRSLYACLSNKGIFIDRSFPIALNHRLLREGMNSETDALIAKLIDLWTQAEDHLGISIDLRVFCYLATIHSQYGPQVKHMVSRFSNEEPSNDVIVGVLSGILWQQPAEVRRHDLATYNPFKKSGYTDPALIRALLPFGDIEEVNVADTNWQSAVIDSLSSSGFVNLIASNDSLEDLRSKLHGLLASPIDSDYLQFFPDIYALDHTDDGVTATLVLRDRV